MTASNIIHLLPTGEGKVIKKTKHGIWIKFGKSTIFINYSETFYETSEDDER